LPDRYKHRPALRRPAPSRFTTRPRSHEDPLRAGYRLCVTKQTLIESWVVATRPRDANGFGYSAQFAAEGIAKIKRLFYLLAETDDIYPAWESLVLSKKVLGKNAYDARLVAAMQVHNISRILTFDTSDFRRYAGIQIPHPDEVLA